MDNIKKFWYESNACWGMVESLEELHEKIKLQLEENNGLDSINDFLDKSKQVNSGDNNFGTRSEHTGKKSLREYLTENNFDFSLLKKEIL